MRFALRSIFLSRRILNPRPRPVLRASPDQVTTIPTTPLISQLSSSTCDRKFFSNSSSNKNGSSLDDFRRKQEQIEEEFNKATPVAEPIIDTRQSEEEERAKKIRKDILEAAMQFVPKYGWSKEAIVKGAEAMGYPGVAHGIFPRGSVELVEYFYTDCTRQLVEWMDKETEGGTKVASSREFVATAVHRRLRMLEPYLSSWPQAIAVMSLPPNATRSLANLLTLADEICYYSGDRAVDFAWYARRVGLAGIYKVTELYMLQDKSEDFQGTATFLQRRIEEAVMLNQMIESSDVSSSIKNSVESAFTTARNLIGFSFPRR